MAPRKLFTPLTLQQKREALDAFAKHGSKKAAAEALGIAESSFNNRYRQGLDAAKRGEFGTDHMIPGFEIASVSEGPNGKTIKSRPQAGDEFVMPMGQVLKGVSALLNPDGRVLAKWIKTKGDPDIVDQIEAIKRAFEDWTPPPIRAVPEPRWTGADYLTIYPIADAHLGLAAMEGEAGEDFNLDIAQDRFRTYTDKLFDRSPNSDTALILQLGDWTHADDDLAMTPTSKHLLQVSHRHFPVVDAGADLLIDYTYRALRKHRRVKVKILPGNHDKNAWIALYMAMKHHFGKNPRVEINDEWKDYWFFRWGKNLIGAHHGHRLKASDMVAAMATEVPEDWGATLYRLFLHGHLHHEIAKEIMGCRVECLRTIASADAHHAGKYHSGRGLVSITLHHEHGQDGRAYVDLPPIRHRATL